MVICTTFRNVALIKSIKFYPAHLLSLLPCKYIHKVIPKNLKKLKKLDFFNAGGKYRICYFIKHYPFLPSRFTCLHRNSLRLDYWVSLNLRFGISGFFSTFERPANFGRALKYVKIVNHNSLITPTFLDANSSKIT